MVYVWTFINSEFGMLTDLPNVLTLSRIAAIPLLLLLSKGGGAPPSEEAVVVE